MPSGALDRMTDLCSGWRDGRHRPCSASRRARACPCRTARPRRRPSGADPWAWHDIGPLEMDWMRRRRLIDVAAEPGRDLLHLGHVPRHGGRGGRRRGGAARVRRAGPGAPTAWWASIVAEPRVLPFPECPAAADAVGALVGAEVRLAGPVVPDTLTGIASCTHLNDLLRALGGVGDLLALASGAEGLHLGGSWWCPRSGAGPHPVGSRARL